MRWNTILHEIFIFLLYFSPFKSGISFLVTPADPCNFFDAWIKPTAGSVCIMFSKLKLHCCTLKAEKANKYSPLACRQHCNRDYYSALSDLITICCCCWEGEKEILNWILSNKHTRQEYFIMICTFLRNRTDFLKWNSQDSFKAIQMKWILNNIILEITKNTAPVDKICTN